MKKAIISITLLITSILCSAKLSQYGDSNPWWSTVQQRFSTWCVHAVVQMYPTSQTTQCESATKYLQSYASIPDAACCEDFDEKTSPCVEKAGVDYAKLIPFLRDAIGPYFDFVTSLNRWFEFDKGPFTYKFPKIGILSTSTLHAILICGVDMLDDYGYTKFYVYYVDPWTGTKKTTSDVNNLLMVAKSGER